MFSTEYQWAWLVAFMLTQLIELSVVGCVAVLSRQCRLLFPALGVAALGSTVTHPAVWFLFPLLPIDYELQLAFSESFALCAEAVLYYVLLFRPRVTRERALLAAFAAFGLSLVANGTSFGVGVLLHQLGVL